VIERKSHHEAGLDSNRGIDSSSGNREERLPQEGNEKLQEWYVKQEEDSLDRLTAK
jgi:hypothetical protein